MKFQYNTSFFRDVKKCSPQIRPLLFEALEIIEQAKSIKEITDLKKLKGHKTAYRIKLKITEFASSTIMTCSPL